jgi:hypothetical protein
MKSDLLLSVLPYRVGNRESIFHSSYLV